MTASSAGGLVPAAADPARLPASPSPQATPAAPLSALWTALAAARAEVRPVERDAESEGTQAYRYASAQAILAVATPLLARHGLVLLPDSAEHLDLEARVLHRWFLLAHVSGASHRFVVSMPVVVQTYRSGATSAIDKAVGIARTVAFRHACRDALGLPQVDPAEDMEHRPDVPPERQQGQHPREAERQQRRRDFERRRAQQRAAPPAPPDEGAPPSPPPSGDDAAPPHAGTHPARPALIAELRAQLRRLGVERFEALAGPREKLRDLSTPDLQAVLTRVSGAVAAAPASAAAPSPAPASSAAPAAPSSPVDRALDFGARAQAAVARRQGSDATAGAAHAPTSADATAAIDIMRGER